MTNSLNFDFERTNYLGHQFRKKNYQDLNQTNIGYYFCKDDDITLDNLKLGSYLNALEHCEIKTPKICSNDTLRDVLNYIVTQREVEYPVFTQFGKANWNAKMWTGAIRFNKTHFMDNTWLIGSPSGYKLRLSLYRLIDLELFSGYFKMNMNS